MCMLFYMVQQNFSSACRYAPVFLLTQNEVFKIDNCDPMQVIVQCMTLDTILYNMFIIHSKIIESDNFTMCSSA